MTSHKFKDFMTTLLSSTSLKMPVLLRPLYMVSQKCQPPLPYTSVTSFINDPYKLRSLRFPNWIVEDSDSKPSEFNRWLPYKIRFQRRFRVDDHDYDIIWIYFWLKLIIFYLYFNISWYKDQKVNEKIKKWLKCQLKHCESWI